jgi:hypothetical protein
MFAAALIEWVGLVAAAVLIAMVGLAAYGYFQAYLYRHRACSALRRLEAALKREWEPLHEPIHKPEGGDS